MTINNKFLCRAYVGKEKTKVKSHRIVFSHNTPGRCELSVEGNPEPNTLIAIDLGWGDDITRVFLGYKPDRIFTPARSPKTLAFPQSTKTSIKA